MACEDCQRARGSNGLWPQFDSLKCVYCAARLIQVIGKRQAPREQITAARKVELELSVGRGLDEKRIRELVKGPLALEPLDKDKGKKA